MFLRAKKVKGNRYYYLVESRRKDGKVAQIIFDYLGNYQRARKRLRSTYPQFLKRLDEMHTAK